MSQAYTLPVEAAAVSLVCVKDVHAAAVPPGRRRGPYGQEIMNKLAWCGELARQRGGRVICAGDLFHIKNPASDSNILSYVTSLGNVLKAFPGEYMFGVVGNHDISGDNHDTLPKQPLGNLIMAGAYWPLGMATVTFETSQGLRVRVDGYDYQGDARVIMEAMQTAEPDPTCHYRVAVAHAFANPGKSTPMFGEWSIGYDDLTTSPYDAFLWGHDHKPKGITQVGQQWHLYPGSLSRASLAADEAMRPVTAPVITFTEMGITVEELEVPTTPLELAFHTAVLEVERADRREEVAAQKEASAAFLQDMAEQVEAVESDDPMEILASITTDKAVIRTVSDYCGLH